MTKVIVGMSGGVDSAVAALLLKKQGYDVVGVTLRTWNTESGEESRCCEIDDARRVCWTLKIPYHTVNCLSLFREKVTGPFSESYTSGLTPNPCINCNRDIKWTKMLEWADIIKADYIATGHYASCCILPNGRYSVRTASCLSKDQTYMLYTLSQDQLKRTLMPLSDLTKEDVRRIAIENGLHVADKKDSQEICFVTHGSYADFIRDRWAYHDPGEGDLIDLDGNVLGRHKGIINYTVGQRKGLDIALGYPAYVKRIDSANNTVVLCREEDLYEKKVFCDHLNFMSIPDPEPGTPIRCKAKIRYHHQAKDATIIVTGYDKAEITFDEPVRAPAPGQSAVFYDEEGYIIGGGVIVPSP